MTPESWRRIEEIYVAAVDRPVSERQAFVREACAGNVELERKILAMMAADDDAASFLESPAVEVAVADATGETATLGKPDDPTGQTFAHYRLLEKLGSGGMGVVYKAEDLRLKRLVAIKLLPESVAKDPVAVSRFEREARAASALNHPNICTIYGVEEFQGRPAIAMELLEGESLRDRIRRGLLDSAACATLGIEICEALAAAHSRGIVHRDIKPGNLFVTGLGHAKVLDFGLAKFAASPTEPLADSAPTMTVENSLTSSGSTLGTASYMSPEQIRGLALDGRSDIFSLGVALYEMATAELPFRGASMGAVFDAILHKPPAAPSTIAKNLNRGLEDVILKCLAKDREARYPSATALAEDLRKIREGLRPAARRLPARRRRRWIAAGVIGAVAVAAGAYIVTRQPPKLSETDTIVLADFANKTGIPVFDDTLRQGFAFQLEQSPYLKLVSDDRIQELLKLDGQAPGAPLKPELARKLCIRNGSAAVLDGEITGAGGKYLLQLTARSCATGELLDREQSQPIDKDGVLSALTDLAARFRGRAGEKLAAVKEHNVPLAEATTGSLEALRDYSAAQKLRFTKSSDALPDYEHAIELDPNFAMAYVQLAHLYGETGDSQKAGDLASKAYALRSRTSELERFYIELTYDFRYTGNLERAKHTLESWMQMYPRDYAAPGFLAIVYACEGNFDKALEMANRTLALNSLEGVDYASLGDLYLAVDKPDEVDKVLKTAGARGFSDYPYLREVVFELAFHRGDRQELQKLEQVSRATNAEDTIADDWSFALSCWGRLKEARSASQHAVSYAVQDAHPGTAALYEAAAAIREALFGLPVEAKARAAATVKLSRNREAEYGAALAYALAKDTTNAAALTKHLEDNFAEDTSVHFNYLPVLRALAAMNHGDTAKALDALEDARAYEISFTRASIHGSYGACYPVYVRGLIYKQAGKWPEAAAEFRKFLASRGVYRFDPAGSLAWRELGYALAKAGDASGAREAYARFFALWDNPDRDIPVYVEAKKEAESLK